MPIVLYKMDASPPCRSVMMVIEILGLNVETRELTPFGEQMDPEFVDKNPVHTIPFIEDRNFKLVDSHAINTYLVSKYGADKKSLLYPSDFELRSTVDQRMYLDAYKFFPKFRELVQMLVFERKPIPTEKQVEEIKEMYGFLEKYLEITPFMAADHVTLADISLVASLSSYQLVIAFDGFPRLMEWYEKMQQFDWYQKANAPGVEEMKIILERAWEKVES
jgi:glutathione S-transferase